MNGWRRVSTVTIGRAYRDGLAGVWDAIVSALTGRPRVTVPQAFTFSIWVKGDKAVELHAAHVEKGAPNDYPTA